MDRTKNLIAAIIGRILGGIVSYLMIAAILTPAWNYVLPHLFNIAKITYLQSFCLLLVIDCLSGPIISAIVRVKSE